MDFLTTPFILNLLLVQFQICLQKISIHRGPMNVGLFWDLNCFYSFVFFRSREVGRSEVSKKLLSYTEKLRSGK